MSITTSDCGGRSIGSATDGLLELTKYIRFLHLLVLTASASLCFLAFAYPMHDQRALEALRSLKSRIDTMRATTNGIGSLSAVAEDDAWEHMIRSRLVNTLSNLTDYEVVMSRDALDTASTPAIFKTTNIPDITSSASLDEYSVALRKVHGSGVRVHRVKINRAAFRSWIDGASKTATMVEGDGGVRFYVRLGKFLFDSFPETTKGVGHMQVSLLAVPRLLSGGSNLPKVYYTQDDGKRVESPLLVVAKEQIPFEWEAEPFSVGAPHDLDAAEHEDLTEIWQSIKALSYSEALSALERRTAASRAETELEVLGIKAKAGPITYIGAGLILLLQVTLTLYCRELLNYLSAVSSRPPLLLPWIGVFRDVFAQAYTMGSLAVAPCISILIGNYLAQGLRGYIWISCIAVAMSLVQGYHIICLWKKLSVVFTENS